MNISKLLGEKMSRKLNLKNRISVAEKVQIWLEKFKEGTDKRTQKGISNLGNEHIECWQILRQATKFNPGPLGCNEDNERK